LMVSDTNEPATWFYWARGHPRAFLHRFRDCVRMGRNGGRWYWHETPCTALNWKYRFICQYGTYFTLLWCWKISYSLFIKTWIQTLQYAVFHNEGFIVPPSPFIPPREWSIVL